MTPGNGAPAPDPAELLKHAEALFEDFLAELESMVNIDCGSYTPTGVNLIADMMETSFRELGWATERRPHTPTEGEQQLGDLLVARLPGGNPRRDAASCSSVTWTRCSTPAPPPSGRSPCATDARRARGSRT